DREWTGRGIDCQFDLRTVALRASRGDAIGIALAPGVEAALAFHRPRQRAQLAIERQFLKGNADTAARVGDDGTSGGETQAIDRRGGGVEAGVSLGPVEPPLGVEPEPQVGPDHAHVDGPQLASKQRPEPELDPEFARLDAGFLRLAYFDPAQHQRRARQDTRVNRAGDAYGQPDDAGRARFEHVAVLRPVDE